VCGGGKGGRGWGDETYSESSPPHQCEERFNFSALEIREGYRGGAKRAGKLRGKSMEG